MRFQWYCSVTNDTLQFDAEESTFAESMARSLSELRNMTRRDTGSSFYYPTCRLEIWLDKWRPVSVYDIQEHGVRRCYNISANVAAKNSPKFDKMTPDELEFCKTHAPIWWKAVQHLCNTIGVKSSPPLPSTPPAVTPSPAAAVSDCTQPVS